MAGTLTATTIQNDTSSPPTFRNNSVEIGTLCRAWINFNGTTSPGTIRGQFNVSSVTKNGTGDYTINFTNAMPDDNYCSVLTNGNGTTGTSIVKVLSSTASAPPTLMTTTQLRIITGASTLVDNASMFAAIFR